MTNKPNVPFNARGLIDRLQGGPGIEAAAKAMGVTPPPRTSVRMWRSRNTIPGQWWPTVAWIAAHKDVPIIDFIGDLTKEQPPVEDLF